MLVFPWLSASQTPNHLKCCAGHVKNKKSKDLVYSKSFLQVLRWGRAHVSGTSVERMNRSPDPSPDRFWESLRCMLRRHVISSTPWVLMLFFPIHSLCFQNWAYFTTLTRPILHIVPLKMAWKQRTTRIGIGDDDDKHQIHKTSLAENGLNCGGPLFEINIRVAVGFLFDWCWTYLYFVGFPLIQTSFKAPWNLN